MVKRNTSAQPASAGPRSVKKAVRSALREYEEVKIFLGTNSGSTSVSGVVAVGLNGIVQGPGLADRVGQKISVQELQMRFQATINGAATSDRVRLICVADTQNQNAIVNVTDVLASASTGAFYNSPNLLSKRFKVFYDRVFQMNTAGNAGFHSEVTIPTGSYPVFYAGSTGYGRNCLFWIVISDTPTNLATYALTVQVRYTDA
jgi:hypothetical protein